jgi:hypothetical protein
MGSRLPLPVWAGPLAVAVVIGLVVGAGPADSDECPASVVWFFQHGNGGYSAVDSFIYDMNFSPTGYDSARVSFDRNEARLSVSAVGALWAGTRVIEWFDVTGVPPGTPVNATLVFRLDGESLQWCGGGGCGVYFGGTLVCGTDSVSADADLPGPCDGCSDVLAATLTLPVTLVAGTPLEAAFTLGYHTSFVGWGQAAGVGSYGITGLPPGVRAIACPGADVTPARPTTWGLLKTTYR